MTMHEMHAMSLEDIKQKVTEDDTVWKTGKWPNPVLEELKPYQRYSGELCTHDGLVLRGHRIVLPRTMVKQALRIGHEPHQGIVPTKQYPRSKFYWPNMDLDVERLIRNCSACVLNQYLSGRSYSKPVHTNCDRLLDVLSRGSSYLRPVAKELIKIFNRFDYSLEAVTDNGRQFVGQVFELFLKSCGIKHIRASPYYPKNNGSIERFRRYLKKAF